MGFLIQFAAFAAQDVAIIPIKNFGCDTEQALPGARF